MSILLRAAQLIKRPVVTLAGDDIAQVKDVVYSSRRGELAGFTLNGRGLFSGPLRKVLPWEGVHGIGPDAVMIKDEHSLAPRKALRGGDDGPGGDVLGSRVITASGRELGDVTDVILVVGDEGTDAVGYEIESRDARHRRRQFVPLPDTLAVSDEALIVPDAALEFIRDDLAGFGAAVDEFRERLRAGAPPGSTATAEAPESTPARNGDPDTADDAPSGSVPPPPLPGADLTDPPVLPPDSDSPRAPRIRP